MATGRKSKKILVLDADMVSALSIARSLARKNYVVDVASSREAPVTAYSNAVKKHYQYPDPLLTEDAFLDWLEQQVSGHAYDLVIPVTERSLVPLANQRERFCGTRLAMADNEALQFVLDKAETFKLADKLGISTPTSLYISELTQLDDLLTQLSYPVVIKPSHSVSSRDGSYSKRNVSYARSEDDLYKQCQASLQHSPVILQSYFSGVGAGVELIARDGEVLYAFQHLRLHEVPLTGGGSSFRVSTEVEPLLLEATRRLVRAIHWNGVAMVEFKWNPDSRAYCLMEINGRFWGSLPLAVAAGADFPAMQAELFLTGALGDYPAYRPGVYCRNLARDLMWLEIVLRSDSDEVTQVPSLGKVLRDALKIFSPRHHFDTQSLRDPLPGLIECQRLAIKYSVRIKNVLTESWFTLSQRLLWRNGSVRESLKRSATVLFICYGNINRSALAQHILLTRLEKDRISVLSAGFHPEEHRPADGRMVRIAAEHNIDLSSSRSVSVNNRLLDSSDIIFVMEKRHYDRLIAMNPETAGKTFLLGASSCGTDLPGAEIADPYNKSEAAYRSCFDTIDRTVTYLAHELAPHHAEH